jgi:hypothetical protein
LITTPDATLGASTIAVFPMLTKNFQQVQARQKCDTVITAHAVEKETGSCPVTPTSMLESHLLSRKAVTTPMTLACQDQPQCLQSHTTQHPRAGSAERQSDAHLLHMLANRV